MDYRILWKQDNEEVLERWRLSIERIRQIPEEHCVREPFGSYFSSVASFILKIGKLTEELGAVPDPDSPAAELPDMFAKKSLDELADENRALYEDILPEHYGESYGNPEWAVSQLGEDYGRLLSFLYAEIRGSIVFAYESRLWDITVLNETFIEIYNLFEEEVPKAQAVKDVLYWFVSDYADRTVAYRTRETLDPELSFAKDIILESDLSDLKRYP